jgi:hypothetical protein
MRRRESPSSPSSVDPEPAIAKEQEAIIDGKPVQEDLMSCPRRYRADYAKPKGWVDIPYMPILADGVTYESIHVISARSHAAKVYIRPHIQLPLNMRGIVRRSLAVAA